MDFDAGFVSGVVTTGFVSVGCVLSVALFFGVTLGGFVAMRIASGSGAVGACSSASDEVRMVIKVAGCASVFGV